ncbi:MAG: phosphodiester glycosidase family protein [Clostridia bacterium]|nr:phosphodiester glycosidase family protein [Clostridia bacterium]
MIHIKKLKVSTLIIIDLLCIALGFGLFCLFHFVIDFSGDSEPVSLLSSEAPVFSVTGTAPKPSAGPVIEEPGTLPADGQKTPENPVAEYGMFGEKFSDKFTEGEVIRTDSTYQSKNINVTVSHFSEEEVIYNIAEIYIRDIKYFKTAFGCDGFKEHTEMLTDLAGRHNAVIAISGDHYGARSTGVVVRNGIMYRNTKFEDMAILTYEGELITMPASEYDPAALEEYGAWQVWCFGPELLDDGNVKTKFNSNVTRANPRTAIGCVEPGHYFFVVIDGRIQDSKGLTMTQLSQLFYDLGCTSAYNLDGGQTSSFVWNGSLISYPYGRPVWDMLYIGEDE